MICKSCKTKLTSKEEKEIQESLDNGMLPEILCDECWQEQQNMEDAIDDFSDADSGL